MHNWRKKFSNSSIFYITPDVKRGIGLERILPSYHIICSFLDPIVPTLRKQGANIFCLEEVGNHEFLRINNSGKLLEHPLVLRYIKKHAVNTPYIAYFKPSLKLDILIGKKGFIPAGNTSGVNEQFENKINFISLVKKYFPQSAIPSVVGVLGSLSFKNLAKKLGIPFVIQFGHGWAGKTTFFICNEKEFIDLAKKFRNTNVKVSRRINGFTVLNNCCIYRESVYLSPPAIQISGIKELHHNPGITCGRQWPAKFIDYKQTKLINSISRMLGKIMGECGFRGFFGLDFLVEQKSGRIYLSEVNARFTASTPFFTYLEQSIDIVPLLAYHFGEFMHKVLPVQYESPEGIVGSQIILRSACFEPLISSYPGFGVYKIIDSSPKLIKNDYHPGELSDREYVFIGRLTRKYGTSNEEIARIEMRDEVLETPLKLKPWLKNLIVRV